MLQFDIYRSGYSRGYNHGQTRHRRLADWELILTTVWVWLPLTDTDSYVRGYRKGYDDGSIIARLF